MEKMREKYQILNSGPEFFDDLEAEILSAQDYIFIKQYLWRNDEAGRRVAQALLRAMERGVRVTIVKDRIGAFHEYSEGTGQSFFHDSPEDDSLIDVHSLKTVYLQARYLMAGFYKNGVRSQEPSEMKDWLVGHSNCTVMDDYKLYDHSKVVIVDGKKVYLGGVGFGDEFALDNENGGWIDHMMKIEDEGRCRDMLRLLSGGQIEEGGDLTFLSDSALREQDSSLHDHYIKMIIEAEEKLLIEMPFLGHPGYIDAITLAVREGVKTTIVLPQKSMSHHSRNMHFLKRLMRQTGRTEDLSVVMTPNMLHGKMVIVDDQMLFGSHNMCMDRSVVNEVVVQVKIPKLIEEMQAKIDGTLKGGKPFDNSVGWLGLLPSSRVEYLSVKLQTVMERLRREEIQRVRKMYQKFVGEMVEG